MNIAPPSRNPTVDGKLRSVLRFVFNKLVQGTLDDMIPAQVIAYNRTTNMASVQPMISMVTTLNEVHPRAVITSVPVFQFGAGTIVFNVVPKSGDLGWLKACDRDISLWKQLWQIVAPNTGRMHSFEDGMFFPSILTGFTINPNHPNDAVIQTLDGTSCAALMTANALIDMNSTTKGLGLPAMTTSQKNAIPSPRAGLIVFDTTENAISVYNGSAWS